MRDPKAPPLDRAAFAFWGEDESRGLSLRREAEGLSRTRRRNCSLFMVMERLDGEEMEKLS